jgi:2,4-dienoyl-CoA reductase-like NADH-dependent reductase (Old Yellow Enzyme family)
MPSPRLFAPIRLRGVEARNRLWVSPLCQWMAAEDGLAHTWHLVNYGAMAAGGAGLIVVESTAVAPEGRIAIGDLGLWNDAQTEAMRPIAEVIKANGAVAAIQLGHSGRKGNASGHWDAWAGTPARATGPSWQPVAPSPVPNDGLATPRELAADEIPGIVEAFASAAGRAVAAGFQAVEVHSAHGYLLHQFLSTTANKRTDSYGGSFETRSRLVLEVVRAVRETVGPEVPLLIRVSATEWIEGGWDLAQTLRLVPLLVEAGIDHIDVSSGGLNLPAIPMAPGYQVPFASAIRSALHAAAPASAAPIPAGPAGDGDQSPSPVASPSAALSPAGSPPPGPAVVPPSAARSTPTVSAVGLITKAVQAEQVLVNGQADAVMVGKAWMANPHLACVWAAELGADLTQVAPGPYSMAPWGR